MIDATKSASVAGDGWLFPVAVEMVCFSAILFFGVIVCVKYQTVEERGCRQMAVAVVADACLMLRGAGVYDLEKVPGQSSTKAKQ